MAGPWEEYAQQPALMPWEEFAQQDMSQQPVQPSQTEDIIASGAAGVGRGAADLVGLPGTIADAMNGLGQWGLRKGYELATGAAPSPEGGAVERFFAGPTPETNAALAFGGQNPLSGNTLRQAASAITGGATDYQPYTTAGEYARTVGEFIPGAMALGGGGTIPNLVKTAVVPGMSSELAGQVTKDTALEPYARIAAALVGGAVGNRIGNAAPEALPTSREMKAAAGYDQIKPVMQNARIDQDTYRDVVRQLGAEARDFGLVPGQHDSVAGLLSRYEELSRVGGASLQDVEILRRSLMNAGKNVTDPSVGELSRRLVEKLDDAVDAIPSTGMVADTIDDLKAAREAWRTASKSAIVEESVERAKNAASGFENGLRTEFRKLLNNKRTSRQFTDLEKDAFKSVVQGTPTSNAMRWLGGFGVPLDNGRNFLGSVMGGGVGSSIGSAVGGPVGAAIGGPLLVGVGTAAKAGANRATQAQATIAEALVKAGPSGQSAIAQALLENSVASKEAIARALLQSQGAYQASAAIGYGQ